MFNNQIQTLALIAGVEDLSQENAVSFCGGRLTLYDGANQTGTSVSFVGGAVANLGKYGFDNKASSLEITGKQTWRLWIDPNYSGINNVTYSTGRYNLRGIFNNSISSVSLIG